MSPWHQRLWRVLRVGLGWLAAFALLRPGRKARAERLLRSAERLVLLRIDDRVGEALLMTPLLEALAPRAPDVVVHQRCVRVLEGHPRAASVVGFDRRLWWLGPLAPGIRALRRLTDGAVVVNCAAWSEYSGTAALVARLGAPRACVIGPAQGPGTLLADVPVSARRDTDSEVQQRLHLLSPLLVSGPGTLSFRAPRASEAIAAFRAGLGPRYAVVNPGGRLDWRRVPEQVFASGAKALRAAGLQVAITWGPGEEPLARRVAEASGATLAPPTTLDELAALFQGAAVVLCNNTGPMHLSVAVGAPTVGLFIHMPVSRWGHSGAAHLMLDLTADAASPAAMSARVDEALRTFAARR
ncbi:MAG: glycosyltransferase family 9 protein [Myxococcaceae bacterium]|nr:glycosyltransferase family 9 protein [Myxococcaceae bacterium]